MEPVMSLTTLLKDPTRVKEAAETSIVRITEHDEASYIFASEESFEEYVERQCQKAVFEARLEWSIERGLADVRDGRVSDDFDGLFARVEAKFQKSGSAEETSSQKAIRAEDTESQEAVLHG